MLEHPDSQNKPEKKKKRVLKAESKNVRYTASSTSLNASDRNQGMDFYIGVVSQKEEATRIYTMPLSCPFQFHQEINGF